MQWLVLEATCSQGAAEALCEELRHNFSWVKRQNKTPKSKQIYREYYYRCLIKSSRCLTQRMLNSEGKKKSQQTPRTLSLQFMYLGLPVGVWDLIQVCPFPSYLRAPLSFPGSSFHISCAQGWDQDHSARPCKGGFALPSSSCPWVLSPGMLNVSAFIKFDWSQMKSQNLVRGEWQVRSLFSLVIFQSGKKD